MAPYLGLAAFTSLLATAVTAQQMPKDLKTFYDAHKDGCDPASSATDTFNGPQDGKSFQRATVNYCKDEQTKAVFWKTDHVKVSQGQISIAAVGMESEFAKVVSDVTGGAVKKLDAQKHPFVITGIEGKSPLDHGVERMSTIAIICDETNYAYALWSDDNGKRSEDSTTISQAANDVCFKKGGKSAFFVALSGKDAVLKENNTVNWDGKTQEVEEGLKNFADPVFDKLLTKEKENVNVQEPVQKRHVPSPEKAKERSNKHKPQRGKNYGKYHQGHNSTQEWNNKQHNNKPHNPGQQNEEERLRKEKEREQREKEREQREKEREQRENERQRKEQNKQNGQPNEDTQKEGRKPTTTLPDQPQENGQPKSFPSMSKALSAPYGNSTVGNNTVGNPCQNRPKPPMPTQGQNQQGDSFNKQMDEYNKQMDNYNKQLDECNKSLDEQNRKEAEQKQNKVQPGPDGQKQPNQGNDANEKTRQNEQNQRVEEERKKVEAERKKVEQDRKQIEEGRNKDQNSQSQSGPHKPQPQKRFVGVTFRS